MAFVRGFIWSLIVTVAIAAIAWGADGINANATITPTKLYELIEKEQSARHKTTHVLLRYNERLNKLENEVARLKKASILTHQAVNKLRK